MMVLVVSIVFLFVLHTINCSKKKKSQSSTTLSNKVTASKSKTNLQKGRAAAKTPTTPDGNSAAVVKGDPNDREQNDSLKTNAKTKKSAEEDDNYKNLRIKLANKQDADQTVSLLAADESNPLADFIIPERPNVDLATTAKEVPDSNPKLQIVSKKKSINKTVVMTTQDDDNPKKADSLKSDKTQPDVTPPLEAKKMRKTLSLDKTAEDDEGKKLASIKNRTLQRASRDKVEKSRFLKVDPGASKMYTAEDEGKKDKKRQVTLKTCSND